MMQFLPAVLGLHVLSTSLTYARLFSPIVILFKEAVA